VNMGGVDLAFVFFFFQAEDGIRDYKVTGVQTCALPIYGFDALARGLHLSFADSEKMLPGVVGFERDAKGLQLTGFDECFEFGHCGLTMRLTAPRIWNLPVRDLCGCSRSSSRPCFAHQRAR